MLGLHLCCEYVSVASDLCLVHRALVDALLFLAFNDRHGLAVDDGYDGELLLGLGLFETAGSVPSCALDLEAEDVGTITVLLLGQLGVLPVHLLLHLSLNVELVELNRVSSCSDLSDGSEEGLWVVQSVDEGDVRFFGRLLLP